MRKRTMMLMAATISITAVSIRPLAPGEEIHFKVSIPHIVVKQEEQIYIAQLQEQRKKEAQAKLASRSEKPEEETYEATWYSGGEITKSGAHVEAGVTIATDPQLIPLGSLLEVRFHNGHVHRYIAQDTGGAIHGHRLDIYEPNENQCEQNGRQHVSVRVLRRGYGK